MAKKTRVVDKFKFLFFVCMFVAVFVVFIEAEHVFMPRNNGQVSSFLRSVFKEHLYLYISVMIFFIVGFFLLVWDNVEKKRKMWRSEEKLLAILSGVQLILFVFDRTGKIVLSEGKGLRGIRLKPKQLVGESIYSAKLDKYSVLRDYYLKALRGEHISGCIQVIKRLYDVKFSPLYKSEKIKNIIGVIAVGTDVTTIKRTENVLAKAKEDALSAERTKAEFLANMSYEMRSLLNIIIGLLDLFNKDSLSKTRREYIDAIKTSSDILLNLINNILDLSKIESGLVEIDLSVFNVREFFQSIYNIFKSKADQKGISLSFNINRDVPAFLKSDVFKIQQILVNLINNAIKFTISGGVYLSVDKLTNSTFDKTKIKISISDTGIGIPDDMREEIFEPFVQVSHKHGCFYEGAGLVAIADKLAKLLGGELKVESKPELGSKFDLFLEFDLVGNSVLEGVKTQVIDKALISSLVKKENKVREEPSKPSNLKILLAEDNVMNHFFMKEIFKNTGHVLKIANNGQEAVDVAENEDFDLILIDIQLPIIDGLTASRIITENKRRKGKIAPPIVAITASVLNSGFERYKSAGISYYLSQPIDVSSFLTFINKFEPMTKTEISLSIDTLMADKTISSLIDINSLLVRTNENEAKTIQMLRYFTNRVETLISNITRSVDQNELEMTIVNSRVLKSEAANVCSVTISSLAKKLETSARSGNTEEVKKNFNKLKRKCEDLLTGIRAYI